jgi:hypothetical protein
MVQTRVTTEWLVEGFKYELGATRNLKTVTYYCGHLYRFLRWANCTYAHDTSLLVLLCLLPVVLSSKGSTLTVFVRGGGAGEEGDHQEEGGATVGE